MPHWERGYRRHGYWTDDGKKRLGFIGLSPRLEGIKVTYGISVWYDHKLNERYDTLGEAKKRVEELLEEYEKTGVMIDHEST